MGNVGISVVIPSLNCGRYLGRAIDSVFQDGIAEVECVVIDGESTDESGSILVSKCAQYGESLVVVREKDNGPQEAANKGWARASGEVLLLIGADDMVEEGALAFAIDWFDKNSDKSLLYGECLIIDERDEVLGRYAVKDFSMDTFLNSGSTVQMPSCFYRRSVIEKIGGMELGNVYADLDWFARIGQKYSFHRSDKVFSRFRFHPGGLTASTTNTEVPKALYLVNRKYGGSLFSPVVRRYFALQLRRFPLFGKVLDWRLSRMDWRKLTGQKRIAVFGASLTGGLCFTALQKEGRDVELYIDNNPPCGEIYLNRKVVQPLAFLKYKDVEAFCVIIATGGFPFAMKKQLRQMGFSGEIYWFGNQLS